MHSFDCNKGFIMTVNDLERQFTAVIRIVRAMTRLRLESRGFRYKVALHVPQLSAH